MDNEEALSIAIFAINMHLYPHACAPADVEHLERNAEDAIELLISIRANL